MRRLFALGLFCALAAGEANGAVIVSVAGTDAIFLANRTDVLPIPAPPAPFILARHGYITPENLTETLPSSILVNPGEIVTAVAPASGGVSYFNGFGAPLYGPDGNGVSGSSLSALDGISGYLGPQGPLVGMFWDNSIPNSGPAPATLDFTPGGLGTDFLSLSPLLGQVFFIGDGFTSGNVAQQFIAPTGATQFFLGIADGFGFVGAPGAYEDNDGGYRIELDVVPEPSSVLLGGLGIVAIAGLRLRKRFSA